MVNAKVGKYKFLRLHLRPFYLHLPKPSFFLTRSATHKRSNWADKKHLTWEDDYSKFVESLVAATSVEIGSARFSHFTYTVVLLKNLIRSETFIFSMKTGKLHLVFNNIRNKTFEYEILLLTIIKYSKLNSMRNNISATCKVVQNVSPHVLSSLKSIKDSLKAKTTPLHYIYRYLLISHNRN